MSPVNSCSSQLPAAADWLLLLAEELFLPEELFLAEEILLSGEVFRVREILLYLAGKVYPA